MNNTFKWFFGLLLFFIVLIIILWINPLSFATGQAHPEYSTLLKSGSSVMESTLVKWVAFLFGICIIGFFCLCVLIGARKVGKDQKRMYRYLFLGIVVYFLFYGVTVFSYWKYMASRADSFVLGFPVPTAWMLYGLGFAPILMTFVYLLKFDDWVLSPNEIERFKEILEARRNRESK